MAARLGAPDAGAIFETMFSSQSCGHLAQLARLGYGPDDEEHRGSGSSPPQQHPGGGPPPKPFVAPRGPNTGAPPGAQIITPGPRPGGEGTHPGMPPSGAEIVRPAGPHPEFAHPGEPHPGAEFVHPGEPHPGAAFVRPGEPHPRAEFGRPGGARFFYRGHDFERVHSIRSSIRRVGAIGAGKSARPCRRSSWCRIIGMPIGPSRLAAAAARLSMGALWTGSAPGRCDHRPSRRGRLRRVLLLSIGFSRPRTRIFLLSCFVARCLHSKLRALTLRACAA